MNELIYVIFLPMVLSGVLSIGGVWGGMSISDDSDQSVDDENGQMSITEKTYKLHTTPATYEEAKRICNKEGGKLAVLNSAADEQKLLDLWKPVGIIPNLGELGKQAYIGMNSLTNVGVWKTIDNTPLKYVNWSQNWACGRQPSDPYGQRCGALLIHGGMDDIHCWAKLAFFCENP